MKYCKPLSLVSTHKTSIYSYNKASVKDLFSWAWLSGPLNGNYGRSLFRIFFFLLLFNLFRIISCISSESFLSTSRVDKWYGNRRFHLCPYTWLIFTNLGHNLPLKVGFFNFWTNFKSRLFHKMLPLSNKESTGLRSPSGFFGCCIFTVMFKYDLESRFLTKKAT